MDKRSIAVLNQLLQSDSYCSVQQLASMFNVSRRTIYNDLDKINYWLKEHDLSEVMQVRSEGYYLCEDEKQQISRNLQVTDDPYYEYSPVERRSWIYIYLVAQERPFLLDTIQKLCRVSRNTALEDIKKLKSDLSEFRLTLFSERKQGYIIQGNENDIRKALVHYLSYITPKNGWHSIADIPNEDRAQHAGEPFAIFHVPSLKMLREFITDYEKEIGIEFVDDVLNNLVVWFFLFIQRMKQGNYVEVDPIEKEVIYATDEFHGAEKLSDRISKQFLSEFPRDEIYFIAKYLLSSKVNYNLSQQDESQEMKKLRDVVEKMVHDFQLYAAVDFPDQKNMIQNLLLHMKPAYYRSKYGIYLENVLHDSVKRNYPEIFHLTSKVIHHFEDLIKKPVSDDEVAFIAMHFGGWLRKEGVELEQNRKKLLIVCTNGLGTSRLLESQLEGLFSDVGIVGVTSLREYEKMELSADFIVSTIPLPDRGVPVFVVNPVLDNEAKENLLKKVNSLFQQTSLKQVYSVDTVMDMVNRYATVNESEALRQELRHYFQTPVSIDNEVIKPGLNELLPQSRINFVRHVNNWEEAVEKASDPLWRQGYIEKNYIDKMIQAIKEHGPYVVISKFIALPHANAADGVIKTGMSMLHLNKPIDVMGKDASIFIVLAPRDNEQHLKALAQLTRLFSDKTSKEAILRAETKEQVASLIRSYSTE
ncbi:BglG family transcription antiterminator [Virgibacillus oceani]|uniref:Transcriptional antiterminator n=1 Tax=Virgibacillus oceani TaxID=1479511 RepID=A0A917HA79_9BACI|nr:BglG family transcription antiterminator [Virgibacillus oceani]GGG72666.1 transcriptional antiterminator [Virgibacillus oceani]